MKQKRLVIRCLLSMLMCLLALNTVQAAIQPVSMKNDKRLKTVLYQPQNVVPIKATTFTATQIVFGKGEHILNIQCGDMGAWSKDVPESVPNVLFIKPMVSSSSTNLTVLTNRRTYYFWLTAIEASEQPNPNQTLAIVFRYHGQSKAASKRRRIQRLNATGVQRDAKSHPENYHWRYTYNGDKRLRPQQVFDDGQFTYIELGRHQLIPAVFAVDNKKGVEASVNIRRRGHFLIIPRVVPQLTLRHGKYHVGSVFNRTEIQRIH